MDLGLLCLRASLEGLEEIKKKQKQKGYTWLISPLQDVNGCSDDSWKRFLSRKNIKAESFKRFCYLLEIDWREIFDNDNKVNFVGRKELINELLAELLGETHFIVLQGLAGIGKTELGLQIKKKLDQEGFKTEHLDFYFEELEFTSVAIKLLHNLKKREVTETDKAPDKLLEELVKALSDNRYYIQIDTFEKLLVGNSEIQSNVFKDEYWLRFFKMINLSSEFKSRLILTSQDLPSQFEEKLFNEIQINNVNISTKQHWSRTLVTGLNDNERLQLFSEIGLNFTNQGIERNYLERIGAAYEGHPYALILIGREIQYESNGDIKKYWDNYGKEILRIENIKLDQKELEGKDFRLAKANRMFKIVTELIDRMLKRLKKDFKDAHDLLGYATRFIRPTPAKGWSFGYYNLPDWNEERFYDAKDRLIERSLVELEIDFNDDYCYKVHSLVVRVFPASRNK